MSEKSVLNDIKNLKSKDSNIKWTAINNLRKYLQANTNYTDFRYRMIIKSLLPFTKDPDDKIREKALLTFLESIPDTGKLETLVLSALSDSSPGIRSLALEWLSNQNHANLKTELIKSLDDPADVVRKTTIDLIVAHKIEGIETKLLQLLESESGGLRRSIIYALGKLKTPRAIGTLVGIMQNTEYDDWTRNQAGSALNHMGGRELIIPFINNLADTNDYVRETAAAFLVKNEKEIVPAVTSSGNINLIALLLYGTEKTKGDFNQSISTLTNQMAFVIKDLQARLIKKDKINIIELADELKSNTKIVKILIEEILDLVLVPLSEETYLTETGLTNLLKLELESKNSIHIPTLQEEEPFKYIALKTLERSISSISGNCQVTPELYIKENVLTRISSEFENSGFLTLSNIATDIYKPIDLIKKELVPYLNPSGEGWYNSQNEYLTKRYLETKIVQQVERDHVLSTITFLNQIGNPLIELSKLKEFINDRFKGKWLKDIDVFLELTEFENLKQDSTRIDESRVSHLLTPINIDFPRFLNSLQRVIDIKTYRTKDGQLITLENFHPHLQRHILSKGYLSIPEFFKEIRIDDTVNTIKPVIIDYITQEFSGRTTPDSSYFISEDLISDVTKEIEALSRINFDVLGYKMDLATNILNLIVKQILFVRGFTNTIGEFVTEKGINKEIQGILEFREEFTIQELLEILEIVKDKKNEKIVRDLISEDGNLLISRDNNVVMTQKEAVNKLIHFIKKPELQVKELIPWEELSRDVNISSIDLRNILDSLIQNNLVTGTLQKQGYRP